MKVIHYLLLLVTILFSGCATCVKKAVPDKLVVLSFDDASASHYSVVAPLLKKYGFGGTFYISEFPPFFSDTTKYMTWKQIQALDKMGFEIGNHSKSHPHIPDLSEEGCFEQLDYINKKCISYGIEAPTTFAYPGYGRDEKLVELLKEYGFKFARIGEKRAYNPETDYPLLVPSWSMVSNNKEEIMEALKHACNGQIVVFTIHGVPDTAHPSCTTTPELFEEHLKYLSDNNYTVIALRDLEKYVNVKKAMKKISYTKEMATFPR